MSTDKPKTQSRYVIGIDPGLKGGVVILDRNGALCEAIPMPSNEDLAELSDWIHKENGEVWIEDVWSIPGWGSKSSFGFGYHIGQLHLIFYDCRLVQPKVWQKDLWIPGTRLKDAKAKSFEAASQYWPHMKWLASGRSKKPHDGMIDAALIAMYGVAHGNGSRIPRTRRADA